METGSTGSRRKKGSLRWVWVGIGLVVGAILMVSLVSVVEGERPQPNVAILIGMLTFSLMGILVGFHSPGRTIVEPGVSGVALAGLTVAGLKTLTSHDLTGLTVAMVLLGGPGLAIAGGWLGELLQGTLEDSEKPRGFGWPWVWAGTILGVMLSCYSVFVLHALLDLPPLGILFVFTASFFVTAAFVGYFSPGVTILEPALAALLAIGLDALLAVVGFSAPFPFFAVILAAVVAFGAALVGGYTGEVVHNLRWKSAWGENTNSYQQASKSG